MFFWSSFPFVRITIPFALGVVLGYFVEVEFDLFSFAFSFCCCLVLFLFSHFFNKKYELQWVNGVYISCLIGWLGFSHFLLSKQNDAAPQLESSLATSWFGKVESVQRNKRHVKSFVVNIQKIEEEANWENVHFNALVYNKDTLLNLHVSDYVAASSYFKEIEPAKNPYQFNYKDYLSNQNIYYQLYEKNFIIDSSGSSIYKLGEQLRDYVEGVYRSLAIGEDEIGILVALTLGDKSQINMENKKAFAEAGAMHILAVSGLHVGIVFLLFNTLLLRLPNTRFFTIFRSVFLVLIIWGFALITGFSPSVQRAGWMFSFVILAPLFRRNSNIINSIFLSAFILILVQPATLFELGFQLSYSAVLGIVLIHPVVYRWWVIENYWFDKLWSLLLVSLAAQLATLPLTLFYFHQFPNYFLITNIFVIPLAFGIVFSAIVVLFVVSILGWHFYLGKLLELQLSVLNYLVSEITYLPKAVSDHLWIHSVTVFLIFLSIIFLIAYLHKIEKKYLFGFLTSILLCLFVEVGIDLHQLRERQITFYITPKGAMFSHVVGLKGELYYVKNNEALDDRIVMDHLGALGAELVTTHEMSTSRDNYLVSIAEFAILLSKKSEIQEALCPDVSSDNKLAYFQRLRPLLSYQGRADPFFLGVEEVNREENSFWIKY